MPPRIAGASAPLAAAVDVLAQQQQSCSRTAVAVAARGFSTTQPQERMSQNRIQMWKWMKMRGRRMFEESGRQQGYVGGNKDQPFPLNPLFRSEPVLSEQLRDSIWKKVVENGEAIKAVSQEFGVDVRRIAAVVRLKEVEQNMIAKVSFCPPFSFFFNWCLFHDEIIIHKFSISLEDNSVVTTLLCLTQRPPIPFALLDFFSQCTAADQDTHHRTG